MCQIFFLNEAHTEFKVPAFPAQIRVQPELQISTSLHTGTWKEIFRLGPAVSEHSCCGRCFVGHALATSLGNLYVFGDYEDFPGSLWLLLSSFASLTLRPKPHTHKPMTMPWSGNSWQPRLIYFPPQAHFHASQRQALGRNQAIKVQSFMPEGSKSR